ncbi:epoxide hydrolase family protein [[Actinomadura] parvosata]|uniref:epoxide hydrolase family protein n=1 Tax=[Actinomadura] parvosata TaxID=1955412 RepID=UPI001E475C86|nr:epoxide hydrolase family protein [Nonomuraea sp. ATCC 55076]
MRPFRVSVPGRELAKLRRRLTATRWPDRETVADTSQGVPLALMREVTSYWARQYDWRKGEAKLNALPQFVTQVDGLDIHFVHVRSKHANALPLIVTHGWPGSVFEQLKIIKPLTDPTAYGASAADAFHLVIPSVPGYGFSERPAETGWGPVRIAKAWVTLMKRLGYPRFVAAGGDIGAAINLAMAREAPPELLGVHTNLPGTVPPDIARAMQLGDPPPPGLSADERRAYVQLATLTAKHFAYYGMMNTRPQTLYGMADSPVSLASWLLDHGDGADQPAAAIVSALRGNHEHLTRDDVLDNVTIYWLTNTGVSASRFYWENTIRITNAADISAPFAVSVFPGEVYQAPRSWTEQAYHNLVYFHEAAEGGHFAAWEQPGLYAAEVRAGLRPLRTS